MQQDFLSGEFPPKIPYPAHALPPVIREAVETVHQKTGAPLAVVAASALTCAATAVQSFASVRYPTEPPTEGYPVSLFFLTVGDFPVDADKVNCDYMFAAPLLEYGILAVNDPPPALAKRVYTAKQRSGALVACHPYFLSGDLSSPRAIINACKRLANLWHGNWFRHIEDFRSGVKVSCGFHTLTRVLGNLLHSSSEDVVENVNEFLSHLLVVFPDDNGTFSIRKTDLVSAPAVCAFNDRVRELLFAARKNDFCEKGVFVPDYGRVINRLSSEYRLAFAVIMSGFFVNPLVAVKYIVRLSTVLGFFDQGRVEADVLLPSEALDAALLLFNWHLCEALRLRMFLYDAPQGDGGWDQLMGEFFAAMETGR